MHYCNTLISTLFPVLTIFSTPTTSMYANRYTEDIHPDSNNYGKASTSDNLFKLWEDSQVAIYFKPYKYAWNNDDFFG